MLFPPECVMKDEVRADKKGEGKASEGTESLLAFCIASSHPTQV